LIEARYSETVVALTPKSTRQDGALKKSSRMDPGKSKAN